MDLIHVKNMIYKQWDTETNSTPIVCPPEAKVITGNPNSDAHLHYLETECGITLHLSEDFRSMVGYDVIDNNKFMLFVLKWS